MPIGSFAEARFFRELIHLLQHIIALITIDIVSCKIYQLLVTGKVKKFKYSTLISSISLEVVIQIGSDNEGEIFLTLNLTFTVDSSESFYIFLSLEQL